MRRLLFLSSVVLATACAGQNFRIHGEQYLNYWPAMYGEKLKSTVRWYSAEWQPTDKIKLVGGFFDMEKMHRKMIDDSYVELGDTKLNVRYGRFRPEFGINSWTDLWYSGLISLPVFRYALPMSSLHRSATGAQVSAKVGNVRVSLANLDRSSEDWQLGPVRPRDWVSRVQFYRPGLIVGLNNYQGSSGTYVNFSGVDAIWTVMQWQVRAEGYRGVISGSQTTALNLEGFYHPVSLPQTTLVGRMEGLNTLNKGWAQAYRVGIKQNFGEHLAVYLNYNWTNGAKSLGEQNGWSLQFLFFQVTP